VRTHRETAILLMVACYIGAMMFFAITRTFGLLWFSVEYIETGFSRHAGYALLIIFWIIDGVVKIKTLTSLSWGWVVFSVLVFRLLTLIPAVFGWGIWVDIVATTIILIAFPLLVNKDKARSVVYATLYVVAISAYQGLIMLGRGYPVLTHFYPSWQIILTLDYRLFLVIIFIAKGVIQLNIFQRPPAGCWLFMGKFDDAAKRIGHKIIKIVTLGRCQ